MSWYGTSNVLILAEQGDAQLQRKGVEKQKISCLSLIKGLNEPEGCASSSIGSQ